MSVGKARLRRGLSILLCLALITQIAPTWGQIMGKAEKDPMAGALEEQLNQAAVSMLGDSSAPSVDKITVPDKNDTLFIDTAVVSYTASTDFDGQVHALVIRRPNAGNYPVSVDLAVLTTGDGTPELKIGETADNVSETSMTLAFAAGETARTVYVRTPGFLNGLDEHPYGFNGKISSYLELRNPHRTSVNHSLIRFEGSAAAAFENDYSGTELQITGIILQGGFGTPEYTVGQTVPITVTYSKPARIAAGQTLEYQVKDAAGQPAGTPVALTPVEAGTTASRATYLYTIREEDILPAASGDLAGRGVLNILFTALRNVADIDGNSTSFLHDGGTLNGDCGGRVTLPPQYGAITTDKAAYDNGDTVTVTVPISNATAIKAYTDFPLDAGFTDWFALSIDGGQSVLPAAELTCDADSGEITATFTATNLSSDTPITYCPEVYHKSREDGVEVYTAVYGAFSTFTVSKGLGEYTPISQITFAGIPEGNLIYEDDGSTHRLVAALNPGDATYSAFTWASSHPDIADITPDGTILLKTLPDSPQTVSFTLTAQEWIVLVMAGKGTPEAQERLVKTVTLTIGKVRPVLNVSPLVVTAGRSQHDISWTYNLARHYHQNDFDYTVKIYEYDPGSATTGAEKYSWPVTKSGDEVMSITRELPLLFSSAKADGAYQPNYLLEVTVHDALQTGGDMDIKSTAEIVVLPEALSAGMSGNLPTSFTADGTAQTIFQGLAYNLPANPADREMRYEVWKNGAQTAGENEDTAGDGVFVSAPHAKPQYANFNLAMPLTLSKTADNRPSDVYTIRFFLKNKLTGEERTLERTVTAYNPSLGDALVSYKRPGDSAATTVIVKPGEEPRTITYDNSHLVPTTGTPQQISDSIIDNMAKFSLQLELEFELPGVYGKPIAKMGSTPVELDGKQYFLSSEGIDHHLKWTYSDYALAASGIIFHAKTQRALYVFQLANVNADIAYTFKYKYGSGVNQAIREVSVKPKNGYVALWEPYNIIGDVEISAVDGTFVTVKRSSLVSGEIFASSRGISSKTPVIDTSKNPAAGLHVNKVAIKRYTELKAYIRDSDGLTDLTGKSAVVSIALLNDSHQLQGTSSNTVTIGANGLVTLMTDAIYERVSGGYYMVQVVIKGYEPLMRIVPQEEMGGIGMSFRKLPVLLIPKSGRSSPLYYAMLEYHDQGTVSYTDLLSLNGGTAVQELYRVYGNDQYANVNVWIRNYDNGPAATLTSNVADKSTSSSYPPRVSLPRGDGYNETYYFYSFLVDHEMVPKGKTMRGTITAGRTKVTLPGIMNDLTPEQKTQRDLAALSGTGLTVPDINLNDLKGNDLPGATNKLFENFSIELPSNLPFTFQVEKEGDEYVVRGVVSINLLPGGEVLDLLDLQNGFDTIFNDCLSELANRNNPSYRRFSFGLGTHSVGAGAFAGIRGYLSGRARYNPHTRSMEISFNDGGLIAEASGHYSQIVPIMFLEIGYAIDGKIAMGIGIRQPSSSNLLIASNGVRMDFEQETILAATLSARAAVGPTLGDIAGAVVGVEGEVGASANFMFVLRPYIDRRYYPSRAESLYAMFKLTGRLSVFGEAWFTIFSFKVTHDLVNAEKTVYSPDKSDNPYKKDARMMTAAQSLSRMMESLSESALIRNASPVAAPRHSGTENKFLYYDAGTPEDYTDDAIKLYKNGQAARIDDQDSKPAYAFDAQTTGGYTAALAQTVDMDTAQWNDLMQMTPEGQLATIVNRTGMRAYVLNNNDAVIQAADLSYFPGAVNLGPVSAVNGAGQSLYVWKSGNMIPDPDGALTFTGNIDGALLIARGDTSGIGGVEELAALDADRQAVSYSAAVMSDGTGLIAVAGKDGEVSYYIAKADGGFVQAASGLRGSVVQAATVAIDGRDYFVAGALETLADGSTVLRLELLDAQGVRQAESVEIPDVDPGFQLRLDAVQGDSFGVFWPETTVSLDGGSASSRLVGRIVAAGTDGLTVSPPQTVAEAPDGAYIAGFDCRFDDRNAHAYLTYAKTQNDGTQAEIAEASHTFTNAITNLGVKWTHTDYVPGHVMPLSIEVENSGYQSVDQLTFTVGGQKTSVDLANSPLNPGESTLIHASYTVPQTPADTVPYAVKAVFTGGGTAETTGSLDTKASDIGLSVLDVTRDGDARNFTLGVYNNAAAALEPGCQVTLGLYRNADGTEPLVAPVTIDGDELALVDAGGYSHRFSCDETLPEGTALYALVEMTDAQGVSAYDIDRSNNMSILLALSEMPEDDPDLYTITFDAGGGAVSPASAQTGADGRLTDLPAPVRDGYVFDGWYTQPNGGDLVTTATVFTSDATIYAHWTADPNKADPPPQTGVGNHLTGWMMLLASAAALGACALFRRKKRRMKTPDDQ